MTQTGTHRTCASWFHWALGVLPQGGRVRHGGPVRVSGQPPPPWAGEEGCGRRTGRRQRAEVSGPRRATAGPVPTLSVVIGCFAPFGFLGGRLPRKTRSARQEKMLEVVVDGGDGRGGFVRGVKVRVALALDTRRSVRVGLLFSPASFCLEDRIQLTPSEFQGMHKNPREMHFQVSPSRFPFSSASLFRCRPPVKSKKMRKMSSYIQQSQKSMKLGVHHHRSTPCHLTKRRRIYLKCEYRPKKKLLTLFSSRPMHLWIKSVFSWNFVELVENILLV